MLSRQLIIYTTLFIVCRTQPSVVKSCNKLLPGQYQCEDFMFTGSEPQRQDCRYDQDGNAYFIGIECYPAPNISCDGKTFHGSEVGFHKYRPCTPVGEKRFDVALLLSIFLGMFGVDRFYLGYPALGLLKLSTFGFLLVGQLIDIILIATQVVKPADGTDYIMNAYGPRLTPMNHSMYSYSSG